MKNSNLTPAEKRRYGTFFLVAAAVFLLIAILFFRAGAMAKEKPASKVNGPSPAVPSDVMPSTPTPGTHSPKPDKPSASEPPEDPDAHESPEPSEPVETPEPTPSVDLYEKLDFRPSSLFPNAEIYVVNSTDGELNVRSGPSTGYQKLGTLYNGTPVEVYTIENNWALIIFEERYAWTSANYLIASNN